MRRLYLAGPMRGLPRWNFPAFDAAKAALERAGFDVISPADLDRETGFDETTSTLPAGFMAEAARRDLEALLEVDGIALLPCWERSSGARLELQVARWLELKVFELVSVRHEGTDSLTLLRLTPAQEAHRLANPRPFPAEQAEAEEEAEELTAWDGERWGLTALGRAALEEEAPLEGPPPLEGEVRIVDPETGGAKGSKPQQPHLIPPRFLLALGEVYAFGAGKYPDTGPGRPNWSNGYAWSLCYSAALRHLSAFWAGEWADPESGLPHLAHAAWHCATLFTFHEEQLGTDDRPAYYRKAESDAL